MDTRHTVGVTKYFEWSLGSRRSALIMLDADAVTLALTYAASGQTTLYVDDDNCPGSGIGSLMDPYCSIQVAIDASSDGDTIEVAPGAYQLMRNMIGISTSHDIID